MSRVNISATVPPTVKADIEGIAELETNSASRIIEKALRAFVATYQTEHPDADLETAAARYQASNPHAQARKSA